MVFIAQCLLRLAGFVRRQRRAGGAVVAAWLLAATAQAQPFAITWTVGADSAVVEVEGIWKNSLEDLARSEWPPELWSQLLVVFAEGELDPGAPGFGAAFVPGSWRVDGRKVRFETLAPLQPGVPYRAEFRPWRLPGNGLIPNFGGGGGASGRMPVYSFYEIPARRGEGAALAQIFPSANVLPANLRAFELHFSAPMKRGAAGHVRLRRAGGAEVPLALGGPETEVWNSTMTQVSLPLPAAPGRFKAGETYTLEILPTWLDAAGRPVRAELKKTFRAGPPDRVPPDPEAWDLRSPPPGTYMALEIVFDEPLERDAASRLIRLRREGEIVSGESSVSGDERRWRLMPVQPWRPGDYELVLAPALADLAGNPLGGGPAAGADKSGRAAVPAQIVIPFSLR